MKAAADQNSSKLHGFFLWVEYFTLPLVIDWVNPSFPIVRISLYNISREGC
jgi:hypothetical protein